MILTSKIPLLFQIFPPSPLPNIPPPIGFSLFSKSSLSPNPHTPSPNSHSKVTTYQQHHH